MLHIALIRTFGVACAQQQHPYPARRLSKLSTPNLTRAAPCIWNPAASFFRQPSGCAVDQGNAEAWFHMGVMYLHGWGVQPSHRQALECFTISAQVGHVLGMYNLAVMHLNDRAALPGVETRLSCPPALALMKKIAEKGSWGGLVQQVCFKLTCIGCYLPFFVCLLLSIRS